MGLILLNLSVDPPDGHPESIAEDLDYNDMESIVEIVLEQVLDIENAIPEQEDDDTNQTLLVKTFQPIFYQQQIGFDFLIDLDLISKSHGNSFYKNRYFKQFQPEITTPPPKA
nr:MULTISPECIES: hypothetical protein [unclassified Allomuricauda]|tara:strand:+ start:2584 stop:2922 length:339 start_codon:yes stop_codon:yes gene_type:complete